MNDQFTKILADVEQNKADASELLPLVYDELRRLAILKLHKERPGQTLQATALVHEAYLRLVGSDSTKAWQSRRHFFAAAAEAMRRILVDNARRKKSLKRGGNLERQEFDPSVIEIQGLGEDVLAVDEALTKLANYDSQLAELVKLRCFAGMTIPEIAQSLEIPPRSADRLWAYARSWLHEELRAE